MPKFERKALLEKFHAMVKAREPIVGGGAGTGLSAKCEEAGGIDIIAIYNSGRYRMAGRGSLAGLITTIDEVREPDQPLSRACRVWALKRALHARQD